MAMCTGKRRVRLLPELEGSKTLLSGSPGKTAASEITETSGLNHGAVQNETQIY